MSAKNLSLALSIDGRVELISHEKTPTTWPHYDNLLQAIRDAPNEQRLCIINAIELVEIQESARAVLDAIKQVLEDPQNYEAWNPGKYHIKVLDDARNNPTELHNPDVFFSLHAKTKARLILRLASTVILYRVRRLSHELRLKLIENFESEDLHSQIQTWIERYDRSLQVTAKAPSPSQDENQKKRHMVQNIQPKRQKLTTPRKPRTTRKPQAPLLPSSTHTGIGPQAPDNNNRAEVLPAISSLYPALSNPNPPTWLQPTQRVAQTDNPTSIPVQQASPADVPRHSDDQGQQNLQRESQPASTSLPEERGQSSSAGVSAQNDIDGETEHEWTEEFMQEFVFLQPE